MSEVVIVGDCLAVMRTLDSDSVDALVTDPPAGIAFMGKAWDGDKGGRRQWIAWLAEVMAEALRVLKPGAHGLVWALPRTSHWTGTALEDAGFEVRDVVTHIFGSGFPKSHDVSKAIDRAAGATREVVGPGYYSGRGRVNSATYGDAPESFTEQITAPATDAAKQWDGFGTALKPSSELWYLIRKPLGSTVAACVLANGTGALNIDGTRVGTDSGCSGATAGPSNGILGDGLNGEFAKPVDGLGRWPPNTLLSHHPDCGAQCEADCPVRMLDEQSGDRPGMSSGGTHAAGYGGGMFGGIDCEHTARNDNGGASRFLPRFRYSAKPSTAEKEAGLSGFARRTARLAYGETGQGSTPQQTPRVATSRANTHATVKGVDLMRWLCRLITPPGGTVLDPFTGSGTTGCACRVEGFGFVGIEQSEEYAAIARARIEAWRLGKGEPLGGDVQTDARQCSLFGAT